jgi:hypothetical protein
MMRPKLAPLTDAYLGGVLGWLILSLRKMPIRSEAIPLKLLFPGDEILDPDSGRSPVAYFGQVGRICFGREGANCPGAFLSCITGAMMCYAISRVI